MLPLVIVMGLLSYQMYLTHQLLRQVKVSLDVFETVFGIEDESSGADRQSESITVTGGTETGGDEDTEDSCFLPRGDAHHECIKVFQN